MDGPVAAGVAVGGKGRAAALVSLLLSTLRRKAAAEGEQAVRAAVGVLAERARAGVISGKARNPVGR